jgi:pyridoxamine 5'-phosphate oxidase
MGLADLHKMRTEYAERGLDEQTAGSDPLALFAGWLDDAVAAGVHEPNAMALATVGESGPSVRIVLLKGLDERGAVFFTNYESRKGVELERTPRAAAVMLWHDLGRQVRFDGPVVHVSAAESDAYFASRPPGARIGAIASPQSRVVSGTEELGNLWQQAEAAGADQRPEHWGGYRIQIQAWEFWQGRANRFHDRLRFERTQNQWQRMRLAP